MLPMFLIPPELQRAHQERRKRAHESWMEHFETKLAPNALPWDMWVPWSVFAEAEARIACFRGDTFQPDLPFPEVEPVRPGGGNGSPFRPLPERPTEHDLCHMVDDERQWIYRNAILPRGAKLAVMLGNRRAQVCFDTDVTLPVLYSRFRQSDMRVWMSITPMEMLTQRNGIRFASADVLVGGLGLGWYVRQIHAKRSVKRIIVVERSKELVSWLGPRVLGGLDKVEVVYGDVWNEIGNHGETKVALDVWPHYGQAYSDRKVHEAQRRNPDKKFWCWGAVNIGAQG